jgi:hypothetical protein
MAPIMMTKNASAEVKELKESGEGSLVFATLNVPDKDGDILLPGAIGVQVVPILGAHDWTETPIGKATIYETRTEARADFVLNLKTKPGKNWFSAIRFDLDRPPALMQYSYAFKPNVFDFGEFEGQRVRFLRKVTVIEISPLILGAGVGTRTLALKGATAAIEKTFDLARVLRSVERAQAFELGQRFEETKQRVEWITAKHYRKVHPDFWLFDSAHVLASMAGQECGVEVKDIKFFREAKPGEHVDFSDRDELFGWAHKDGNVFWLNEDCRGSGFISTVAHEVKHLSQPVSTSKAESDWQEQEASIYGNRFASRFGFIPSWVQVYIYAPLFETSLDHPSYETHKEAPRGSCLIHRDDGWLYVRDSYGWQKIKKWR